MGSANSRHSIFVRRKEDRQRRKKHKFMLPILRSFSCGASSSSTTKGRKSGNAAHLTSQGILSCGNKLEIDLEAGVPRESFTDIEISEAINKRGKRLQNESRGGGSCNRAAISLEHIQSDITKHATSTSTSLGSKLESSLESVQNEVHSEVRNNMEFPPVCEISGIIRDEASHEHDSCKYELELRQDNVPASPAGVLLAVCSEANPSQRYNMSQVSDVAGVSNRVLGESCDSLHNISFSSSQSVSEQAPKAESLTSEQLSSGNSATANSSLSSSEDVGGVIHVEAFGLIAESEEASSSSRGVISVREARRNNRRRLWDALTRATSRRRISGDADSLGYSNDTWGLFDWESGPDDGSFTDSDHLFVGRSLETEERRWRVRSQVWALQRLSNGIEGGSGHLRPCRTGIHSDGRCTCETYAIPEESNTRASISRIVMLAEALFEVLDEIHRQSVALSRSTSLSLVSLPAPDSIVDSFPLRVHMKSDKPQDDDEEAAHCYICLIEYAEGDHVRILPCKHEYHMACVDKWLKEVHRVCPLCRDNVCEPGLRNVDH